jgi:hypothetical protein
VLRDAGGEADTREKGHREGEHEAEEGEREDGSARGPLWVVDEEVGG